MNIGFLRFGPAMRDLWINLATQFREFGHQVYFLDVRGDLVTTLVEQFCDRVIKFDEDQEKSNICPKTRREAQIVDFNNRHRDIPISKIQKQITSFDRAYDDYDLDMVVTWNDLEIGTMVAERRQIRTFYFENGYLPNTIQFDQSGVNRNSSVFDLTYEQVINLLDEPAPTQDIYSRLVEYPEPTYTDYLGAVKRKIKNGRWSTFSKSLSFNSFKTSSNNRTTGVDDNQSLPDQFLFIPFQVHDDTQVIYNSEYVNNMYEFLDLVRPITDEISPDLTVVVKEHPQDIGRIDYTNLRKRYPNVIWLQEYSIKELVSEASVVVTLNSSVGFQALAKYTPVVTLGESMYDSHPYVFNCKSAEEVCDCIETAISTKVEAKLVDPYVKAFTKHVFLPWNFNKLNEETISYLLHRILKTGVED